MIICFILQQESISNIEINSAMKFTSSKKSDCHSTRWRLIYPPFPPSKYFRF